MQKKILRTLRKLMAKKRAHCHEARGKSPIGLATILGSAPQGDVVKRYAPNPSISLVLLLVQRILSRYSRRISCQAPTDVGVVLAGSENPSPLYHGVGWGFDSIHCAGNPFSMQMLPNPILTRE